MEIGLNPQPFYCHFRTLFPLIFHSQAGQKLKLRQRDQVQKGAAEVAGRGLGVGKGQQGRPTAGVMVMVMSMGRAVAQMKGARSVYCKTKQQ